jgi:hypothetical protein
MKLCYGIPLGVVAGLKPGLFAAAKHELHEAAAPEWEPLEGVFL